MTHTFEQWSAGDIHDIEMTCVIVHNAVVSVRINQNQKESNGFYSYFEFKDGNKLIECSVAPDEEEVKVVELAQL